MSDHKFLFQIRLPSGMAERIIQARIEANETQIQEMIREKAEDLGITPEEVWAKWLSEANFDPSEFDES